MAELFVGGFSFKNRYKTLRDAIENSRVGDIIYIEKLVVADGITIPHDLTLATKSGGAISVGHGSIGLVVKGGRLTVRDVSVAIPAKSNFIGTAEEHRSGSVTLENVSVGFDIKADPRDYYTSVNLSANYSLLLHNSKVPYLKTVAHQVRFKTSDIGNFFGKCSEVVHVAGFQAKDSTIANLVIEARSGADTSFVKTISIGNVEIFQDDDAQVDIDDLTFEHYDTDAKTYRKTFGDHSLYVDTAIGLSVTGGQLTLRNYMESSDTAPYDCVALVLDNTTAEVINDTSYSLHMATDSTITTRTDQEWNLENSSINNPDEIGKGESDAYKTLMGMIGLSEVKAQIERFINTARINAEQKRRGIDNKTSFANHMVFEGPPGTGKTTVAELLGKILVDEGVLTNGKMVSVGAKDFVSKWVGETKTKTHDLILSAMGGILFVDEAYSLLPRGENNHNQEAVDQIVEDAMKYKDDLIIILGGYKGDMEHFLEVANTGLNSRFTQRIEFTPYNLNELVQIMIFQLQKSHTKATKEALELAANQIARIYHAEADPVTGLDGNGRYIENLIGRFISARNNRLAQSDIRSLSDEDLITVTIEDVKMSF